QGNVFAAFVSDRVDVGNTPAWVPKPKTESDTAVVPTWRIYVSSLVFDGGSVPGDTQSPIGDFNGWAQANTSRWFNRAVATSFPTTAPASLFTLSPGDALVPGTVQFGAPSFPSSGAFDQTDFPSAVGRTGSSDRYMAFLGTATASDGAGNRRAIDQLMVANLHFAADGTITENAPAVGMPYDLGSNKSKPSLVQLGTHATVFYTTSSTGFGRVNFSSFDGTNWLTPRSLDMGNAFENVGQPSAVLRRWRNEDVPFIDLAFSAKIRGRAFAEAFLTRLEADANGVPLPDQPQRPFGPRIDPLELDPSTGDYWAPGAVWRLARNDLVVPDPTTPFDPTEEFIDIFRLVNGNYVSVLDKTTRSFDRETGVLTHNSTLGGKVYVDTKTGSVRFSGSLVPRSLRLYVRYAPTYLKVSTGPGANYQSASMVYDDRFIGVYENTADPIRNLLGDISYWGDQFSSRPPNDALLRWDRHVMTFTRTSGDGTQTTRPFMSAYRFGIQLPTPVAINPNGTLTSFTVQWIDNAGLPGSEQYFQVDPGTGRVFFMAGMEDRLVRIVYTGLDQNGNPIGPITYEAKVDPTVELREEAIAIEQPGNETGLSIALDPLSNLFNRQNFRRPPLYWLFWTSTRVGVPDVFFETIAPRFTPKPPN
ncbi:MAG TPA: hypothetical protein VNI20_03305, partial [Fimbriimonadaceae bacterium]|nr:hypothetical protein [Fimbriimonadaceae bacterium]